jgi:hypothetical protein
MAGATFRPDRGTPGQQVQPASVRTAARVLPLHHTQERSTAMPPALLSAPILPKCVPMGGLGSLKISTRMPLVVLRWLVLSKDKLPAEKKPDLVAVAHGRRTARMR